jgi:hypothetical protein
MCVSGVTQVSHPTLVLCQLRVVAPHKFNFGSLQSHLCLNLSCQVSQGKKANFFLCFRHEGCNIGILFSTGCHNNCASNSASASTWWVQFQSAVSRCAMRCNAVQWLAMLCKAMHQSISTRAQWAMTKNLTAEHGWLINIGKEKTVETRTRESNQHGVFSTRSQLQGFLRKTWRNGGGILNEGDLDVSLGVHLRTAAKPLFLIGYDRFMVNYGIGIS